MRIVIDLQACQNAGSRFRGIGRYSKSLAMAMLREGRGHDYWIVLNGALTDAVEDIRASFDGLIAPEQIVLWDNPFPASAHQPDAAWSLQVAEVLREDFLHALQPDIVHLASLFEGWGDAVTTSIGRGSAARVRTAVTLYDLIPLTMSDQYLPDVRIRRWYDRKLEDLHRADLSLAISAFTRDEAVQLLDLPADRVVNISGAFDPVFRRLPLDPQRSGALAARYGIWRPFVMYAGGFDPRKNVSGLIRAYAALPGPLRERRQLVIVGTPPSDIHSQLLAVAAESGLAGDEVRFVGFVPDGDLVGLYNACVLYVFPSRCEGFGLPALEAMACGAPVIGADATSLPEVIGYPEAMFDADSDAAMGQKLYQGLTDEPFRARLIEHGAERVRRFSWQQSASKALDAMEATVGRGPNIAAGAHGEESRWRHIQRQSELISRFHEHRPNDANSARRLAAAQSENAPVPGRQKQLIVDITNLVNHDANTGIQRVVRNILRELLDAPPEPFLVVPVYFDYAGVFRHARGFLQRFQGLDGEAEADDVLDAAPGDLFLGLDLSAHIVPHNFECFDRLRRRGVSIYFVVYDLIPLHRPDCVNPDSVQLLWAWYNAIGKLADGLCCISKAVAEDLALWCDQARPPRLRPLRIGHFHLGARLDQAVSPVAGLSTEDLDFMAARQSFLMVGTIEPRKGYAQTLDAFELLWDSGEDLNLILVGQPGWLMSEFLERLRGHREWGRRLHWFDGIDDVRLHALYAGSSALIAASEAEGFGLPIVEAAMHGLPVIAREIPVFVEIGAGHVFYFSGNQALDIASAVRGWIGLQADGKAPSSANIRWLGWRESAAGLLSLIVGQRWDLSWQASNRYWFPANDLRLKHQVGTFDRQQLVTDGRSGFLVFGPYASVPAGSYRLHVFGQWCGTTGTAAWLDVVTGHGGHQAAHVELLPGAQPLDGRLADVGFELETDAQDLEIRLWVPAEAQLVIHGFELLGGKTVD